MTKTILIIDSTTGQPVLGALVFVGFTPAVELGSGKYSATFNIGASLIRITAVGYTDFRSTFQDLPTRIALSPSPVSGQQITIVCPPGQCTVTINGEQVVISGTSGRTSSKLVPGSYPFTVTKPGYTDLSGTITVVGSQAEYVIGPLQKATDSGTSDTAPASTTATVSPVPVITGDGQGITQISQADLPPAQTQPANTDYEFIYPNSSDGKYFTTTQARLYIGNLFIDEMDVLQVALQSNQIPVYGYSSSDFDAVGRGKSLVQGQLAINFISEGYLYTVLSEYKRRMNAKPAPDPDQQLLQQLYAQKNTLLQQSQTSLPLSGFGIGTDTPVSQDAIQDQLDLTQGQIDQLHAKLGKASVDAVRVSLVSADRLTGPKNAVYVRGPFNIEYQFEGGGRKVVKRIENCFLTGNEQVLDQSGMPIKDVYSFMARRMN